MSVSAKNELAEMHTLRLMKNPARGKAGPCEHRLVTADVLLAEVGSSINTIDNRMELHGCENEMGLTVLFAECLRDVSHGLFSGKR